MYLRARAFSASKQSMYGNNSGNEAMIFKGILLIDDRSIIKRLYEKSFMRQS